MTKKKGEQKTQAGTGRVRVLIADDESITRMDLSEMLRNLGYLVVGEAVDARTAVNMAREIRPDVVIMDIRFEGDDMDGIEAARILMEERVAPVLLLSAYGDRELVQRAKEAGVMGYLLKPFREADLPPAIEVAMANFQEWLRLEKEARDLKEALETRKLVERAKGILMDRHGLSEAEAFRRIQKMSMDNRRPMKEIAQAIILAYEATLGKKEAETSRKGLR